MNAIRKFLPRSRLPQSELVCAAASGRHVSEQFRRVLSSSPSELAAAYARRVPRAAAPCLERLICEGASRFILSGTDLMVTQQGGKRGVVVIETNSAPGFAYCTPGEDAWEMSYVRLTDILLARARAEEYDGLALLTESKVPVETTGFATALADRLGRPVAVLGPTELLAARREASGSEVELYLEGRRLTGGIRYLHDSPWRCLPPNTRGTFVNGTAVDLAGGRDKLAAALAFESFNENFEARALAVASPRTHVVNYPADVSGLPLRGRIVVQKVRHGNSGVGVNFTVHRGKATALEQPFPSIIQEFIPPPPLAHADEPAQQGVRHEGRTYACDLRVVVAASPRGFEPLMLYARRARRSFEELPPLDEVERNPSLLDDFLKVNIARRRPSGGFVMEEERIIFPDEEGWRLLGLDFEDYQYAVAQAILAAVAVDRFGRPFQRPN